MSAYLEIQREFGAERRDIVNHKEQQGSGLVEGRCPGCDSWPFLVECHPPEVVDDHTMRAGARCVACDDPVGWVYFDRPTIFGAEEDGNVLEHGRARVY